MALGEGLVEVDSLRRLVRDLRFIVQFPSRHRPLILRCWLARLPVAAFPKYIFFLFFLMYHKVAVPVSSDMLRLRSRRMFQYRLR